MLESRPWNEPNYLLPWLCKVFPKQKKLVLPGSWKLKLEYIKLRSSPVCSPTSLALCYPSSRLSHWVVWMRLHYKSILLTPSDSLEHPSPR